MFCGPTNIPVALQGYIIWSFDKKLDGFIIIYLNNIFIYIKDQKKSYIQAVCFIFN